MKKVLFTLMCIAAMLAAGTGLRAQEVTIVLMPGYTWISIPTTDTLDFGTALGSFTPAVGDMIKSRWGAATFRSDGQWRGSISEFYPGYGYHYYSNRNVPVLLTFNAQQPSLQVQVTTSEPMLITGNSAMGGGEVTTTDGTYILVKGLCWATHENPTTNEDFYQEAESGVGTFSVSMTGLNISTTYYVRAYAVTPNGTVYGDQKNFTTRDGIPAVSTASVTSITGVTASCGGTVTDNGGLNVTARGVCWSTSQNPTLSDSHTTNGSGLGSFTSSITGLSLSTTYYVRAYATTSAGTAYGEEVSFTTRDGIPTVTTAEVTNIQGETATCGGNVTDNCGLAVIARGVCWSTSPTPTIDDSHTTNGSGDGSFSSSITGLTISTTYYVRAYATTSAGTDYGEQVSFTTRNGIPTVTTADVTNIQGETATCGGNVTDNCGLMVTARGVCWSTSPNPTIDDSHTTNGSGMGSFTSSITGLTISTTYYVRAYATTSAGTGYGEQGSFTTRNGIPTVTTADITNILGDGATGGGNVTDNGGLDVVSRGVCWSTSPNPTLADSYTASGNGIGAFISSITGLSVSTTYYVRAYVTNSFVTVYGNEKVFTTQNGIPSVTTAEITNIGLFSTICGGNVLDDGGLTVTRGVCWSTTSNPTLSDSHTSDGSGLGNFSSHISGLNHSTTYYIRAYATTNHVTTYGEEISFTTLELPEGAIDGAFSVSTSRQVCFSQGNLQYQASTNTWKFADNQYDYVGGTNNNISSTYSGWIDLFGWGTSGYSHGANCYQPWSTSTNDGDYFAYGNYSYNLFSQTGQADWGYNPISNGGNQANQWRTLNSNEWAYVFNTRTTSSGIRYAKAKVNNVNGVILLPDDWNTSYFTLNNTNSDGASFSSNIISATQWNTLEQHGAVFLPAAGNRYGTSVSNVGSLGSYWSATHGNNLLVWRVLFNGNFLHPEYGNNRYYGFSVRLIRVAE